mgnify:CR=1 FL=1
MRARTRPGAGCRYIGTENLTLSQHGPKFKNYNNFSIDRYDPRLTYQSNNIIFCCFGCNDRKHNSNPDDWKNYLRIGKELINDQDK